MGAVLFTVQRFLYSAFDQISNVEYSQFVIFVSVLTEIGANLNLFEEKRFLYSAFDQISNVEYSQFVIFVSVLTEIGANLNLFEEKVILLLKCAVKIVQIIANVPF
ncbi:hypothetical protein GUJ93_ZPchr0012g19976 [Zizania palustris]|uniref:Uncharacterized protein n=1 Tax=Zizania palustris TaxID=103762 RepID=A0A8J5WXR6_ZIZPA|nr:hypothetical protein GUJ93_ZPchr0012g19976 [Zizania palustris]